MKVTEGKPFAASLPPLRTSRTRWVDATGKTAEHGLDDDPSAIVFEDVGDDLVTKHEGERDDLFEVAGALAVDGCKVGAANSRQARPDPVPVGARQFRYVDVEQPDRPDADPTAGADRRRGDPRRGETMRQPFGDER